FEDWDEFWELVIMGSYSLSRLGEWELQRVKSEINPTAMLLFTEADKRVRPRQLPSPDVDCENDETRANGSEELLDGEEPPSVEVEYLASLPVVRDRLEFMGFTLEFVREAFLKGVQTEVAELEKLQTKMTATPAMLRRLNEQKAAVLRSMTFD